MARRVVDDGKMLDKIKSLSQYQLVMSKSLYSNAENRSKINQGAANVIANYFSEYIDSLARSSGNLSHVYENGMAGDRSARLFEKRISRTGDGSEIAFEFIPARVPEDSGHVFRLRAEMMENGGQITIRPKNNDFISFELESGEMVFTNESIVKSVGGKNNNAFRNQFEMFMQRNAKQVLVESKFFDRILARMKQRNEVYIPRLRRADLSSAKVAGERDAAYIAREAGLEN